MYTATNLYFPGFPGFPGNRPSGNGIPGKYESGTYDNPNVNANDVVKKRIKKKIEIPPKKIQKNYPF